MAVELTRTALRTPEVAVADEPRITIELTKEQQLEILAATGLLVKTLELPWAALAEGGEALARIPLPEWLRKAAGSEGKEVNADVG